MAKKYTAIGVVCDEHHSYGLTQAEIAEMLGVSRARVSFLERSAMRKLKIAAEVKGISLFDVVRDSEHE